MIEIANRATDVEIPDLEWCNKLLKAELHCHIGGSVRPETAIDLARKQGLSNYPTKVEDLKKIVCMDGVGNLSRYLEGFDWLEAVMRTPEGMERAAYELAEDAARENVMYLEARYAPTNYEKKPGKKDGMRLWEVVDAAHEGLKRAERDFKIKTGLILCGIKTDKEATQRAIQIACTKSCKIIGFDMCGKEYGHRPKDFAEMFIPLHDLYIPVTIHAGEAYKVESIKQALFYLNASRIGHGTTVIQSRRLRDFLDRTRITLEVCLTSNLQTGATIAYETHPVRTLFLAAAVKEGDFDENWEDYKQYPKNEKNQGHIRVTFNTDNRTISNTNLSREIHIAAQHLGFTKGMLKQTMIWAIKSSFATREVKRRLLARFKKQYEEM